MKKILMIATVLFFSTTSTAGLLDVYKVVDTNNTSTKVDSKAAEVKSKIDSKLSKITEKATKAEDKTTAKQEEIKATLEERLAELTKKGEGDTTEANNIKAEIESLQKLINAARQ